MQWIILLGTIGLLLHTTAYASSGYRIAHPLAQIHMPPTGETPGWGSPWEIQVEHNHSNIWNAPASFTNLYTGDIIRYEMDYEQASTYLEFSYALLEDFQIGVVGNYYSHQGGSWDHFIDEFHRVAGLNRFDREFYPEDRNLKSIMVNGFEQIEEDSIYASGNFKLKFKYWPWKLKGTCNCGLAFSGQVKIPTSSYSALVSTGKVDISALLHFGTNWGSFSSFWITAGLSQFGENPLLSAFPTRIFQQMYDFSLELGWSSNWSFLIQHRLESPLLDKHAIAYNYLNEEREARIQEKVSSGWNSLVHWRGTGTIGVNYKWGSSGRLSLLFLEDIAFGDRDQTDDLYYVSNAPDVGLTLQLKVGFE